jgi:hypothetical protein
MVTGGNTALDPSRQSYQLQREGSLAYKEPIILTAATPPPHPNRPRKDRRRTNPQNAQPVTPLTVGASRVGRRGLFRRAAGAVR